jgi:hypothetical protein
VPKTPDTHLEQPIEVLTHGKRYYVVDDKKQVFGADLSYADAHQMKERVAGNTWSRTPAIREMPRDAELARKIAARVHFGPPRQADDGKDDDYEHTLEMAAQAVADRRVAAPVPRAAPEAIDDLVADVGDDDLDALDS